jgi:hypothetical protein
MALSKSITLPNGIVGSYIRVADSFELNRRERTLTAHVTLFTDAAHAATLPNYPLAVVGLVQLSGAKFDEYVGRDALAQAGGNVVARLYVAAKVEALRPLGGLSALDVSDASDV